MIPAHVVLAAAVFALVAVWFLRFRARYERDGPLFPPAGVRPCQLCGAVTATCVRRVGVLDRVFDGPTCRRCLETETDEFTDPRPWDEAEARASLAGLDK